MKRKADAAFLLRADMAQRQYGMYALSNFNQPAGKFRDPAVPRRAAGLSIDRAAPQRPHNPCANRN
jgi:hypothetical protein